MHPYVKHHPPIIALVVLVFNIMIVIHPKPTDAIVEECSYTKYAVQKIRLYADSSHGLILVDGHNRVSARHQGMKDEEGLLFKVTIDKHYMLLYHIKSEKFICWNRNFKKLVPRRNPTNLSYCKFEDKIFISKDTGAIRLTTTTPNNTELEMRFNRIGVAARDRYISHCIKTRPAFAGDKNPANYLKLDIRTLEQDPVAMERYMRLTHNCVSARILPLPECSSAKGDFCKRMQKLKARGHSISPEINELCSNQW